MVLPRLMFFLYVVPNSAPICINLQASHTVDASTVVMGSVVYYVSANDNVSSALTFSMTSSPTYPDLFSIDAISGEVIAQQDLKYAVDNAYILTLAASDSLETTIETLTIFLTNVNIPPTITNLPDILYMDEDKGTPNALLFRLATYDPDAGDTIRVTFTVQPAVYTSKFIIDSAVKLKMQAAEYLDYDVNEACVFDAATYYATMDEGAPGVVTGIYVTNEDTGDTYSLSIDYLVSAESSYFSIDDVTGVITFSTDYDVDSATYPSNVTLTVVCTDYQRVTATLSVTILDINDNAPQFSESGYTQYITQYDGPGTTVKKLDFACDDNDSGVNGIIEYTWSEQTTGSSSYFYLSPSGVVSLLTYPSLSMTFGDVHSFIVTATDKGTPTQSGSATIDVIYQDGNLNTSSTVAVATTITSPADDNTAFWDDSVNIVVIILAAVLGVVLAVLLSYLCVKLFRKWNTARAQRRKKTLKQDKRKVEPLPDKEKTPFDFCNNS